MNAYRHGGLGYGAGLLLALGMTMLPAAASDYQPVAQAGNWTLYRNNDARPFKNYFAPLAIGLGDADGRGAVVIECRPDSDALNPGPYSVRTGQFYLNFLPSVDGLVSTPWYTPVSFWPRGDDHQVFATRLPFVTGIMMDKLGFNRDGLYDEAKTMITLPVGLTRELSHQLGARHSIEARFYDLSGAPLVLGFDATGFRDAMSMLETACDLVNQRFGN